jgi:hypothetical protein
MSDLNKPVTEAELKARSKKPRVTTEDLEASIKETTFLQIGLLTICVLELQNGFMVTGESACADPDNFDQGFGQRLALYNAKQAIWKFLGYELKTKLSAIPKADGVVETAQDRVVVERFELAEKLSQLRMFINSPAFKGLPVMSQTLLNQQENTMSSYHYILGVRLDNW